MAHSPTSMSSRRRPGRPAAMELGLLLATALIAGLATAATPSRTLQLVQTHYFDTGYDGNGAPLVIPAIDPAGIAYHAPSGHLFIADSEINEVTEVFDLVGGNIFETSADGDSLFAIHDTTVEGNNEPTGIAYNAFDGYFYMSNDDARKVYRYSYDAVDGFAIVAEVSTSSSAASDDPEGLTTDPDTGLIYVVDGVGKLLVVYRFDETAEPPAFVLENVFDLAALNDPAVVPADPEGICFDTASGNLFISSDPDNAIYEYTTAGLHVSTLDLGELSPAAIAPQGLCQGAPSSEGGGLADTSIYIADGMVDNDANPAERDGRVFEVAIVEEGSTNQAPVIDPIGAQFVDEGSLLTFTATASDADLTDELSFSLHGFVPEGASIDPVTGVFTWTPAESQAPRIFDLIVRVTDDGLPPLSDEAVVTVTANELNQPPVLDPVGDQSVVGGTELSFTATASDPDLAPGLWEDLIAYWPFDSDFGDAAGSFDGSPVGNAQVITDDVKLGAGALYLDGAGDYLDVTDIPLPGDLSVSLWVRPEAIQSGTAGGANGILLGDTDNADWFRLQLEGVTAKWNAVTRYQATDPDFVNGSWQHVMLVRTDGQVTVYRDNVAVASFVHTEPFTPELIGCKTSGGNYYQGRMDDLAIWDRALSDSERASIYNAGAGLAIGDAQGVPANVLSFSLEGDVPEGASIGELSGIFSWYPDQAQTPGVYSFGVRVTDDGVPSYFDEETITVTVEDGGPIPPDILPIADQEVDEESVLSFIVELAGGSGPDFSAGLVSYWPFDTDFGDQSGSHDGSPVGDAAIIDTGMKLGAGALYLDGAGDYLDVADIPLPGDLSISLWVLPEAIQSGTAGGANGILLGDFDNADWLRLQLEGVTAKWNAVTVFQTTEPDFTNGDWQHVVFVRSGSQVTVYRNNVVTAVFTHTEPFTPELIGCKTSGGNYFQGTMDDLAIWERPLSGEEVAALYNDGEGLPVVSGADGSVVFSLEGDPPAGAAVDPESGFFSWTPAEAQGPDTYQLTVKATDAEDPGLFDLEDFGVTVHEVNAAPVLDPVTDVSANEGEELSLTALATDPDIPNNDLSFSLGAGALPGMAIDPLSGTFTWTPTEAQGPGSYPVLIQVSDDGTPSLTAAVAFSVDVAEVNVQPEIAPIGVEVAVLDSLLSFPVLATDADALPGLGDGLIAHWPFDTDYASTTGQHDGVPVGGASIVTTPGDHVLGGGALSFDGTDDYLDFGATPLPLDFTVSAWVRPTNVDSLTSSSAIVFGDGANANWIRLEANSVRTKWDNVTTVMTSEPDFVNDAWQLFSLVRSGSTVSVYRNGDLIASAAITAAFTPEYLGIKTPNTNHYAGLMDDVAVWGRALDASEILQLYNGGLGTPIADAQPVPANTLAYSLEGEVPAGAAIDPVTGVFTWTPSAEQAPGEYELTARVTDDGAPPLFADEIFTVLVFEEAPELLCQVDPDQLDFGVVAPGDTLAAAFTIRNPGVLPLDGEVTADCEAFAILAGGGPFSLAGGDSLVVTVAFVPTEVGDYDCSVQLGEIPCGAVACTGRSDLAGAAGDVVPAFSLRSIYPNPFNPSTRIEFGLAEERTVRLVIFDVAGRRVRELVNETLAAGVHAVVWDGRDDQGRSSGSGVYFARLDTGDQRFIRKMALLK